jgi:hypothetical protein
MYECVCMCVYACVCLCVYVCVRVYACMCVYARARACEHGEPVYASVCVCGWVGGEGLRACAGVCVCCMSMWRWRVCVRARACAGVCVWCVSMWRWHIRGGGVCVDMLVLCMRVWQ